MSAITKLSHSHEIQPGQVVQVRSRRYLVQQVHPPKGVGGARTLDLACLDDDAQGQSLSVFWEQELDARILGESSWEGVGQRGFDTGDRFSAYLHTLRWNCVTSTKANLFQSPYRAGIQVKAYQLEPLRKALQMPRVSLFIADDVGLGKTIEAGLILRELILRQKVERVVISCPPSVVQQWQEEMETRFGLLFQVFDRAYVAQKRRQRGYGINPWKTHNRFIISHALLREETYAAPLRDWLNSHDGKTLLILDEAHNAAPASSARYAVDSQLTKTVRELCPLFEHKLFLSATPHNGHSNSFAALLEMLDPQRFCRGIPVSNKKLLDDVMVRRLKKDLRGIQITDFPERQVIPITIEGLPQDAPELVLAELLEQYRHCRQQRLQKTSPANQRAAMLVVISLQKRLLSSIEAFARTLKVHRTSIERQASTSPTPATTPATTIAPLDRYALLEQSVGYDDDRAELTETEIEQEEDAQMVAATQASPGEAITPQELELLGEMTRIAEQARRQGDGRIRELVGWIQANLCPDLGQPGALWNDRRVLIFTEYTDTKRYLKTQLEQAIAQTDQAGQRLGFFHGGMGDEERELIKAAFNANPQQYPLRILIATDAAREGVNLQNYCADLFHFDVPWNPSRMEQRNGRIDRKLQREPVVRCHYFVYSQRPEDKVLQTLVTKTETIAQELGSLSPVLEKNVDRILKQGIQRQATDQIRLQIERADQEDEPAHSKGRVIKEELEAVREVEAKLQAQQQELEGLLERSRQWLGFEVGHFQEALSVSLNLMGVQSLRPGTDQTWEIPDLEQRLGGDPAWAATLDSLRTARQKGQTVGEWRRESPVRPVVFADPNSLDGQVVHLHLEHRLVQRLLGRFMAQGFVHHELNRACVCRTRSAVPKVIVLGRLSLYGDRAARLHDEVLAVAAEWIAPGQRGGSKLRPLTMGEKDEVLEELEQSLGDPQLCAVSPKILEQFQRYASQDVADLRPHLDKRSRTLKDRAIRDLTQRGEKEAKAMVELLESQRKTIEKELPTKQHSLKQLALDFSEAERRQLKLDVQFLENRLTKIDGELETEPQRIRQTYEVKADRVEPVGLVYLWPLSN